MTAKQQRTVTDVSRAVVIDEATGWTTGVQFPAGAMTESYIFATASRPVLGPTQSPN